MSIEPTTGIVVAALIVAAVFCALRVRLSHPNLNDRLAPPNWDFGQSWASNLAAVGSILGVVLGVSTSLPQGDLGLTEIFLSLFFAVLIILGPITFLALGVAEGGNPAGSEIEGTLGGFFVASGLVLWAAVGELVAAAAFFVDLRQKLPVSVVWLFLAAVAVALIVLGRYAWLGMGAIVMLAVPGPAPDVARQPRRAWSLI